MVGNVSTPMTGRPSRGTAGMMGGDNGINGIIAVSDDRGTELLLGAAMPWDAKYGGSVNTIQ